MMKRCKNCTKQKNNKVYHLSCSPRHQIQYQYKILNIATTPKIQVCNDQYMLNTLLNNQRKTKKLDKQIHKMKAQIRKLQHTLQHKNNQFRNQRTSQVDKMYLSKHSIQKQQKSRRSSINSSKNRQVGRFTRVSEGDSQSFSKNSIKQIIPTYLKNIQQNQKQKFLFTKNMKEQKESTVSFSKNSNIYLQNTFNIKTQVNQLLIDYQEGNNQYNYPKYAQQHQAYSIPTKDKKDSNEQLIFQMYLPTYKKASSSQNSKITQQNNSQLISKKAHLKRQFQQLILLQKNAQVQDKQAIRQQIKALQQMLQSLQD